VVQRDFLGCKKIEHVVPSESSDFRSLTN